MLSEVDPEAARDQLHGLRDANPDFLPARVASARIALSGGDGDAVRSELEALVGEGGVLDSALDAVWCCRSCGQPSEFFSWRCEQCRQWGSPRLDMGGAVRARVAARRERRKQRRGGTLGNGQALPEAALDSGLSEAALLEAGTRRSALGRAGRWVKGALGAVRGSGPKSPE